MCDLCDKNEQTVKFAKLGKLYRAKQLRRMADMETHLAEGRMQPHLEEAKELGVLARQLIRYLAEDYL